MKIVRLPASALTVLFAALTLGPLLLLTYLAISRSTDAVEEEAKARLSSTALITGDFVRAELEGLSQVVQSYAMRPLLVRDLRTASPSGRRDLRWHLRELQTHRPGISIAFAADPAGRLLDIVPATPSIIGRDFSFRDWYRGVTSTGKPYISEAYVTAAKGNDRVVAVAAPVRGGRPQRLAGVLVAAYSLSYVQEFTERLARDQGVTLTVTDQAGVLVAAPAATSRALVSHRRNPRVAAALRGESGIVSHSGENGLDFSAFAPVPGLGWTVTASVPHSVAFARVDTLRDSVLATAAGLAIALVAGIGLLGLTLRRREQAEERERDTLRLSERRNDDLARARDDLELQNAELDAQTTALAQTQGLLEQLVGELEEEKTHAETLAAINGGVLDATPDGLAMVDLQGRTVLTNAAMRRFLNELGLAEDGDGWREHAAHLTTDPERFRALLETLADDPQHEAFAEFNLLDGDRVLQLHSAPVRDADGAPVGRIFGLHDVTRERHAERAKSELIATVSHELRTPLTGILGFAELLAEHEVDRETRQDYVKTIAGEALRLKALVDDFLDLHRLEEGNFTLSLVSVPLDEVVAEQARFYRSQSPLHTIEVDVEPELTVLGERDRLAQVLANLLTNAIKYSPEGGPVHVSAKRSDAGVCVEVRDTGIGIPYDQQRRVFEKFFRVDSSDTRRIGGTGLGLTLCRDIVEAHGGRIDLDSVAGKGSTFRFVLPTAEAAEEAAPPPQRVLVVEDDADLAELLRLYLAGDGYEVEVVATGEEALARADQRPVAIICLDLALSGRLDGWGVLTRLKGSPRTAHIPVVICSGSDSSGRALALGAAGFLSKPIARGQLLAEVHDLVHKGRGSVLVVDDDEQMRTFLAETLTREGLEVRSTASGPEGLDMARQQRPDLLLLDLLTPGTDGFSMLEQLRVDDELSDIPVVVLTAQDLDAEQREHLRETTASVVEKRAYSAQELRVLVEHVLAA